MPRVGRSRGGRPGSVAVAVTGGIGAGKSTFCRLLRAQPGVVHIDADRIVRGLLSGSPATRAAVRGAFGPRVVGPDGRIDRARLARRVFADRRALARLEALLHPEVKRRLERKVRSLMGRQGVAIVVAEIPLLAESGVPPWCDVVVTVEAPVAVRTARLMHRGFSAAAARQRMARQAPPHLRRRIADVVIDNTADRDALREEARRLWQQLRRGKRS